MVSLLATDNLCARIEEVDILKDVSLQLAPGEMLGLIGPNGAGKTTLLRCLAGLLSPESGGVSWEGRSLSVLGERQRSHALAYLAQGAPAHWPLSVERVVELGRIPHRAWWQSPGEEDAAAVKAAMHQAEVSHLGERIVTTLSGGERTRVLLARVFATQPRCILADEPVASLDPYHQLHVMELLRTHASGGRAVVVVLHDLELAARYCDRLILLSGGELVAQGDPRTVLAGPAVAESFGVELTLAERDGLWVRMSIPD